MRELLNKEFEQFRPQLKSYILRITASLEDTEDIVQDNLKAKKRWTENVTDISREAAFSNGDFLKDMMNIRLTSEQGNFEIKEHIAFCFTCIAKSLPLEQQITLLLKEVYDFKVKEYLFDLRMKVVKGIDPFQSGAAELQLHHLEHNSKVMESFLKKNED